MIHRKRTLRGTIQAACAGYTKELVVLPGWPQYCVTRAGLHCMAAVLYTRHWDRKCYVAYARIATATQVEMTHDQALDLCRKMEMSGA